MKRNKKRPAVNQFSTREEMQRVLLLAANNWPAGMTRFGVTVHAWSEWVKVNRPEYL